ncbi:16S rRNA (cytidine(1402)-2'-O)-methyltransferase [hydrothermal vent metagenome]|uniref:16S rRNA (Cytidine(1402)-2'-O)-methyltransferase n=1 Tax=hydrothermal vent metagenome TaxID=652676 RepID=A0A3B1C3A1_9ZZZZ
MNEGKPGALHLVATPIGNLGDITFRAVELLKSVDVVAAEDTRRTRILLDHYDIKAKKLVSYHSHNLERRTRKLIQEMTGGASVALVSDAGTPSVSDPGAVLVKEAVEAGITIIPVPGATAPVLAMAASGFPSHSFIYEGFLPRKKGRKKIFESWKEEKRSIIFFESPQRVVKTLREIGLIVGKRKVCIAREITKKFEEFLRGDIDDVMENLEKREKVKGEITIVIAPCGWETEKD